MSNFRILRNGIPMSIAWQRFQSREDAQEFVELFQKDNTTNVYQIEEYLPEPYLDEIDQLMCAMAELAWCHYNDYSFTFNDIVYGYDITKELINDVAIRYGHKDYGEGDEDL